jgi:hypothetical protein
MRSLLDDPSETLVQVLLRATDGIAQQDQHDIQLALANCQETMAG